MSNRKKHSAHSLLRRLLALSLSFCLLLGVLPLNVFADGEEEPVVQSEETVTETTAEAPTDPPTQPPTEAPTAPPTEPETTAVPTDPPTEPETTVAPTVPETTAPPTDPPTEPEAPTQSDEPSEVVYTVTFYNKRTNATDEPLELEARPGDLLADLLTDAAWADETLLVDCTWYAKEDTDRENPIDLEKTTVEGDMELCTYDQRPRPMRPMRPLMLAAPARAPEVPTFTVTFHDIRSGTPVGTTQPVSATQGQTLSEVITQQSIVEGPWYGEDGTEADTTAQVTANLGLYTNDPTARLTVTFHDQRTNEAAPAISVYADAGDTPEKLMGDRAWEEVPLSTLNWYSDAAMTTQADLTTPIQESTNLYAGVQWNITVKTEGNRLTMTIPATVGEQRPIMDQFKNYIDQIWYTVQDGVITVINFNTLVTDGVPEAMEAYTDATPTYQGLVFVGDREVKLYALENRQKVSLLPDGTTLSAYVDGGGQVWVPVAVLESALAEKYAQWGVDREPIDEKSVSLAYSQHGTNELMPCAAQVFENQASENQVFTRLENRTEAAEVYYFPNDSVIQSGIWISLSNHLTDNSVFSVTIEDSQLNQPTYYMGGTSVTVKLAETKTWTVREAGKTIATLPQGTTEYTIESIEHNYVISTRPDFEAIQMPSADETTKQLDFYVSVDGSWQKIASKTDLTIYRDNGNLDYNYVRKYLSAADLEEIYEDYHFHASQLQAGSSAGSYFAYKDGDLSANPNISINRDRPIKEVGSQKYVPITSTYCQNNIVSVFYIPKEMTNNYPMTHDIQEAQTFYTVNFHDVTDGTEEGTPTTVYALNGTTLADAMAGQFWGGTSLNTLKWYTKNKEGEHTVIDPATTIMTSAMDVYASDWAVTVAELEGGERLKMTIPVTQGEFRPTIEHFQGYTQYVWYTVNGTTKTVVNFQDYVTNGVTAEVTAYTDKDRVYQGLTPELDTTVNFYVFFNEKTILVDTRTDVTRYKKGDWRYLEARLLAEVYENYGFTADMLKLETRYFPHSKVNENNIWVEPVIVQENMGFTRVLSSTSPCNVYYLPNQTLRGNGLRDSYKTDGFYTFTVTDPMHKIYATDNDLPKVVVNGENASVTVENVEGITWECRNKNGQEAPTETVNGNEITYTAPHKDPTQQYVLTPAFAEGEYVITYEVNRPEQPLPYETPTIMGQEVSYKAQITTPEGSQPQHKALALNRSAYNYQVGKYMGEASFTGWVVWIDGEATEIIINPGENVLKTDVLSALLQAKDPHRITLKAQWKKKMASTGGGEDNTDIGVNSTMVNFYVRLNTENEDTVSWPKGNGTGAAHFLDKAVFASDIGVPAKTFPKQVVLGGRTSANCHTNLTEDEFPATNTKLKDLDAALVKKLTDGFTLEKDGEQFRFQVEFPTDEVALARVRERQKSAGEKIRINEQDVPVEDLTAENFTIKWFALLTEAAEDGWHINGILVAKNKELTVTKTFTGDDWSIDAVQPNFYIDVDLLPEFQNSEGETVTQENAVHRGGRLILDANGPKPEEGAYYVASHSPGSNTYTWTIPVDLYYRYRLTEVGEEYTLTGDSAHGQVTGTSRYNISNSKLNGDTHGWQNYTESEGRGNVIATAGNPGLTVAFQNSYTPVDVITLLKQDFTTREPIEGVQFQLFDEDGTEIPLRTLGGNRYYPAAMEGAEGLTGGTEAKYITTDANGLAYLKMNHEPNETRTFYLQELPLEGYQKLSRIEVVWGQETNSTDHILEASCAEDENETEDTNKMVIVDAPSLTLVVNNKTPHKTKVKVVKNWLDQENTEVELQLYRKVKDDPNARLVPVGDPVTLNNTIGWEKTFDNLPLYVDGKPVTYEVRELAIGDFKFSSEFPTGFQYYHVSFDYPVYEYKGEPHTHENINQITLEVKNSRHITGLHFRKVNTDHVGLVDAEFTLYPTNVDIDFDKQPPTEFDRSNGILQTECLADGTIVFRGMAPGKYFMEETKAPQIPEEYERDTSLFAVHFDGLKVQVYKAVGETWEPVDHNHIVNHLAAYVPVTIQKQVTGAMGDRSRPFQFTVTSTTGENGTPTKIEPGEGYTLIGEDESQAKFSLKHNQSVTLYVKKGSTLTIRESGAVGYTMSVDGTNCTEFTHVCTVPGTLELTVTNDKQVDDLDTGVVLDTLPYLLLLAIAIGGAVLLLRRRRRDE